VHHHVPSATVQRRKSAAKNAWFALAAGCSYRAPGAQDKKHAHPTALCQAPGALLLAGRPNPSFNPDPLRQAL